MRYEIIPVDPRQQRVFLIIGLILFAIVIGMICGVQAYRRAAFPRSVALIVDVWEEERRGRRGSGPYMDVIGRL